MIDSVTVERSEGASDDGNRAAVSLTLAIARIESRAKHIVSAEDLKDFKGLESDRSLEGRLSTAALESVGVGRS